MSNQSVHVVAQFKAKPGKEAELRKELTSLLAPSRKDEGCISYHLHQALDNPAVFVFIENWTSKALLDKHLATPHLKAGLGHALKLITEPPQLSLLGRIES